MSFKALAHEAAFYKWIRAESSAVGCDGCTGVPEIHQECCLEHDLAYRYKRDPRAAFELAQAGVADPWLTAPSIARREADKRFRECNQRLSRLGQGSPLAWWRWAGVRLFGGKAWANASVPSIDLPGWTRHK